ncbi:hypothetical protein H5410_044822 [Solanum commersonii]|uniref:Uncharacterized protein n=1 Tax=Solanum commersonii TaxID=4109 RepID=A0A9J5XB04_SOLCO|nr:hypothetical protein H5410_044822 [Solanum commersonii]
MARTSTSKTVRKQYTSTNLNKMFEKPFTPKIPKDPLIISPQTSTINQRYDNPEDIGQQPEIQEIEIPSFYDNKRIIGMSTIIQELANNYLNGNAIWSYYSRDQFMIYSKSRELRQEDMDEVQTWILSQLKPEEQAITKALKKGFISNELLTRYCKLIGHKYPDHICSKCNGEDNVIPDVQLE